ncbi:hypothetical protein JR316_0000366 [Psilocybe cubensis]|uniref:Uncharacterized protein n=2 Tax=Psilocybe cubensis TaxID=181762 RepID=A0ACB8HF11_PSICU|nr:hypothetical protein JR316_0000366 [Psilocybe cubensis]KAH9486302.1 hypothetical protein JR316_0000366 [Psilocybe cubensis]
MSATPYIEFSVNTPEFARAVVEAGANGIEIVGTEGITTTFHNFALIMKATENGLTARGGDRTSFEVTMVIRPRTGDLVYNSDELKEIREDIKYFKKNPLVTGFKVGAMTVDGDLNFDAMLHLQKISSPKKCLWIFSIIFYPLTCLPMSVCFAGYAFEYINQQKLSSVLYKLQLIEGIAWIGSREIVNIEDIQSSEPNHALFLVKKAVSLNEGFTPLKFAWEVATQSVGDAFFKHPYYFFLMFYFGRSELDEAHLTSLSRRLLLTGCSSLETFGGRSATIGVITNVIMAVQDAWSHYVKSKRSMSGPSIQLDLLLSKYESKANVRISDIVELYALD